MTKSLIVLKKLNINENVFPGPGCLFKTGRVLETLEYANVCGKEGKEKACPSHSMFK